MFEEIKSPSRSSPVTVISIIKNEIFFLPAFLDHYRNLGVRQFIFLDDGSSDGGFEYLKEQPDCALLISGATYGQYVDGKKAHVVWRTMIPRTYCKETWALVVDADEFLELPPGFENVATFVEALDARGSTAVGAVMIDFYPSHVKDLELTTTPQTKSELFSRYPFFDDYPHGYWSRGKFIRINGGVRDRLLRQHGLFPDSSLRSARERIRQILKLKAKKRFFNAIQKVPLVRWLEDYEYLSSHSLNVAPTDGVLLPLIHFKFTGSLVEKIRGALESRAYYKESSEYQLYEKLLAKMRKADSFFICEHSRRYNDVSDLVRNGLVRFEAC